MIIIKLIHVLLKTDHVFENKIFRILYFSHVLHDHGIKNNDWDFEYIN